MHYSPRLPIAKERHNQEYAPNLRTSDARTDGQSPYARDVRHERHVINNIQGNHLRAGVLIVHQPQTVVKYLFVYLHKME